MPQNEIPRIAAGRCAGDRDRARHGARRVRRSACSTASGVLVIRDANGAWQAPRMIQITGGSFGYQIGVQATDLVLVFRTPQSVAELAARHDEDRRRCVGRRRAGRSPNVGRHRPADCRPKSCRTRVLAARLSACRSTARRSRSIRRPKQFTTSRPARSRRRPCNLLQCITCVHGGRSRLAPPCQASASRRRPQAVGSPPGQRRRRCRSGAATTRQPPRGNCRPTSTTIGSATWPCRRKCTRRTRCRIRRRCSRRCSATKKSPASPNMRRCTRRPEFQQTLASLRRLSEVRTASNTSLQLAAAAEIESGVSLRETAFRRAVA